MQEDEKGPEFTYRHSESEPVPTSWQAVVVLGEVFTFLAFVLWLAFG